MTDGLPRIVAICAAGGAALFVLCLAVDPRSALIAYLAAWFAVSSVPIGALGVLMVTYLVRAGWTADLHRPLSRAALTLPLAGLLFIPVLAGLTLIYPWAGGDHALPGFKAVWLTPWFFVLRSVIYFAVLTAVAVATTRAYGDDDAMKRAASAGLIVWTLVVSFAGVDWAESVEPEFHSSIYGLLILGFDLLSGFAFALAALGLTAAAQRMKSARYGAIFISVILLWAYLHAMQYIIIWAGNIPDEVRWYLTRMDGGWIVPLWALFVLQAFVPFFALLSARLRGSRAWLTRIAVATLLLRGLEAVILIVPPLAPGWIGFLSLPAALVAMTAAWLLCWHAADLDGFALWRRRPAAR